MSPSKGKINIKKSNQIQVVDKVDRLSTILRQSMDKNSELRKSKNAKRKSPIRESIESKQTEKIEKTDGKLAEEFEYSEKYEDEVVNKTPVEKE